MQLDCSSSSLPQMTKRRSERRVLTSALRIIRGGFARTAIDCIAASIVVNQPSEADAQAPPPEVSPPQVAHRIDATYPASAAKAQRHADVVLNVTVDVG